MGESQTLAVDEKTILVVDDSGMQRLLLRSLLNRNGYSVLEASDGQQALKILQANPISLVLSDWMMPKLTGPELCTKLRAERTESDRYTYFILLTARSEGEAVAEGLTAGADDFLSKPVNETELIARLSVGERLVAAQARLLAQKAELKKTCDDLETAQAQIERDLRLASMLQRETAPPLYATCNGTPIAAVFQAAHHVGGDLIGYFPIGTRAIGFFSIDVAGHGVAPALRAANLAQLLSKSEDRSRFAFTEADDGSFEVRDPADIVCDLNERFVISKEHELYFTMVMLVLDLETGEGRYCRAGHLPPILQRKDGEIELLQAGGPPVGLLQGIPYNSTPFELGIGDRVLLHSDGLSEAEHPENGMIGLEGLTDMLTALADREVGEVLPALVKEVRDRTSGALFDDDVSALLLERPDTAQRAAETASPNATTDCSSSDDSSATSSADGATPPLAATSKR